MACACSSMVCRDYPICQLAAIPCRNLRSDVAQIFSRLRTFERTQQSFSEQIDSWRTIFSAAGNTSAGRPGHNASEQMQISPVGAEGSNVMPCQPARQDAVQSNMLMHLRRDGTPHAGSTAGETAQPSHAVHTALAKPPGKLIHNASSPE